MKRDRLKVTETERGRQRHRVGNDNDPTSRAIKIKEIQRYFIAGERRRETFFCT